MASPCEFEAQRQRAGKVLDWYRNYSSLVQRLGSGRAPAVVDGFCGAGGVAEGMRRAGGRSLGMDLHEQPDYVRRFGEAAFWKTDASSATEMRAAKRHADAIGGWFSPPCQPYSTATMGEGSEHSALIPKTRAAVASLDWFTVIENVT